MIVAYPIANRNEEKSTTCKLMSSFATFKITWAEGQHKLSISKDSCFKEFVDKISEIVKINKNDLILSTGYPLKVITGDGDVTLELLGISSGSLISVKYGKPPSLKNQVHFASSDLVQISDDEIKQIGKSIQPLDTVDIMETMGYDDLNLAVQAVKMAGNQLDLAIDVYQDLAAASGKEYPNSEKHLDHLNQPFPIQFIPEALRSGPRGLENSDMLDILESFGYNDSAIASQAIEVAGNDVDLAIEIYQQIYADVTANAPFVRAASSNNPIRQIRRHVINADNSCLFNAIGYLIMRNSDTLSIQYRKVIADEVTKNTTKYTPEVLGKPTEEYAEWIMNSDKWGGEIEMSILAKHLNVEIAAVDIQTGKVYIYGEEYKYFDRIYLLYDGIHYDAVVNALIEEGDTSFESNDKNDMTIFGSDDATTLDEVKQLASKLRNQKQFVDLAGFDLQCLVCRKGLKGQSDATAHAKETGHQNFGQINSET